jgi:hypothetical protein
MDEPVLMEMTQRAGQLNAQVEHIADGQSGAVFQIGAERAGTVGFEFRVLSVELVAAG